MDQQYAWFYALQVHDQAAHVRTAHADLASAVKDHDMARLWYSMQMLLGAAAMLSKLLWPANDDKAEPIRGRGAYLREHFKIGDDSPLKDKKARNASEHFDERIDDWVLGSEKHSLADSNVGPLAPLGVAAEDVFRHYDPDTDTVIVCGVSVTLPPLLGEVERILAVPVGYATKRT